MTAKTTSSGRPFQRRGTATEKAALPTANTLTGADWHYAVTTLYPEIKETKMLLENISYKTPAILVKFDR